MGGDGAVTPPDQSAGGPAGAVGGSGRSSGVAAASGSDKAPVNLNTANQSEFETIDGVGPVTAGKIMAWRQEHGQFASVDQLREISGIGAKTFEKIKPYVTV